MPESPSRFARIAARAGSFGALLSLIGPGLAHFELVKPMAGFVALLLGALLALVATVTGAIALLSRVPASRDMAVRGFVPALAVVVAIVIAASRGRQYPRINDITTDTAAAPEFRTAATLPDNLGRDLRYPGTSFAEQQRAGYPGLGPLRLDVPPSEAFARVAAAAHAMPGWRITREDATQRAIEGVDTTWLFRFQDDFVIEVREQNGHSIVHMRSKSRDGKGDIGANAKRIEAFFARLERK